MLALADISPIDDAITHNSLQQGMGDSISPLGDSISPLKPANSLSDAITHNNLQ